MLISCRVSAESLQTHVPWSESSTRESRLKRVGQNFVQFTKMRRSSQLHNRPLPTPGLSPPLPTSVPFSTLLSGYRRSRGRAHICHLASLPGERTPLHLPGNGYRRAPRNTYASRQHGAARSLSGRLSGRSVDCSTTVRVNTRATTSARWTTRTSWCSRPRRPATPDGCVRPHEFAGRVAPGSRTGVPQGGDGARRCPLQHSTFIIRGLSPPPLLLPPPPHSRFRSPPLPLHRPISAVRPPPRAPTTPNGRSTRRAARGGEFRGFCAGAPGGT